jgi:hypothetical protein
VRLRTQSSTSTCFHAGPAWSAVCYHRTPVTLFSLPPARNPVILKSTCAQACASSTPTPEGHMRVRSSFRVRHPRQN